jgi:hypothetical protein
VSNFWAPLSRYQNYVTVDLSIPFYETEKEVLVQNPNLSQAKIEMEPVGHLRLILWSTNWPKIVQF